LDQAYRAGKFKSFGFSNYTAAEVEEFVKICEEKGFVKPSVYQGQYNPIVRTGEKELFPVLRKHGIVFYAWRSGCSSSPFLALGADIFEQSCCCRSLCWQPQEHQDW